MYPYFKTHEQWSQFVLSYMHTNSYIVMQYDQQLGSPPKQIVLPLMFFCGG